MSFRFWRRIRIAPGVTLNLSKSGGSLSFGPRGAKFTIGPRGKRATMGIPGTGLFYTTTLPSGRSGGRKTASYSAPAVPRLDARRAAVLVADGGEGALRLLQHTAPHLVHVHERLREGGDAQRASAARGSAVAWSGRATAPRRGRNLVFGWIDERWMGTGRTVFDNKENVVKQYEPFFSSTPAYEDEDDLVDWG